MTKIEVYLDTNMIHGFFVNQAGHMKENIEKSEFDGKLVDIVSRINMKLLRCRNLSIFSFLSSAINSNFTGKYLKILLVPLLILLLSAAVFATHNPSVSHSANSVTNGTFLDNYSYNGTVNFTNNVTFGPSILIDPLGPRLGIDAVGQMAQFGRAAGSTGGNWVRLIGEANNYDIGVATASMGGYWFLTDTVSYSVVLRDNKLGINNTMPNATLHLMGKGPEGGFRVTNQSNGAEVFFVNSTLGAVGIGTTAPSSGLHLSGKNLLITSGVAQIQAGSAGSPSYQFQSDGDTGFFQPSAETIGFSIAGSERVRINSGGNVGIGTAAPYARLQVNGTLQTNESVYLATGPGSGLVGINNTAPNATLHIMGIGTAGGFRVTNQSNAYEAFFVNSTTGRVGIGTASPTAALHVEGMCVTGRTRLRKKKKNAKGYEEVKIKDIKEGDEIQTLNESTGRLVWRKVSKLMDMGVKAAFKLTTEDGRSIETTATHPYLVLNPGSREVKHESAVNNAGWLRVDQLKVGDYIAVPKPRAAVFIDDSNLFFAQKKAGWRVDYKKLKALLGKFFEVEFMNYYLAAPAKEDETYEKAKSFMDKFKSYYTGILTFKSKPLKYIYDGERKRFIKKGDVDSEIIIDALDSLDRVEVVIIMSGDSDYIALARNILRKGKKVLFLSFRENTAWEINAMKFFFVNKLKELIEYKEQPPAEAGVPWLNNQYAAEIFKAFGSLLYKEEQARTESRVPLLKDNCASQLNKDFIWARINSIEAVGDEQVYDIEVEGTHNFIGNDIVAHNTYISGFAGLNATSPNATLHVLGTGTAGGLRVTNQSNGAEVFFVNSTLGAVGIGTTDPQSKLHVVGGITSPNPSYTQSEQFGSGATITNSGGTALGYGTSADFFATAVGNGNSASNSYATAVGYSNNVAGLGSFSIGTDSDIVSGADYSATFGYQAGVNNAAHDYAFVFGRGTTSGGANQFIIGNPTYPMNVGIGTATPANTLVVNGTGATGGFRVVNQSNSYEAFFVNSTLGRVGIGTAAPRHALTVVGDANVTGTLYVGSQSFSTIDATGNLTVGGYGLINGYLGINATTPNATLHVLGTGTAGGLRVTNQSNRYEAFFVNSTLGAVGIGTTGPAAKLEVSKDSAAGQSTVLVIKQDDPDGDQGGSMSADIDFHLWDANTRLSTPQARIGVIGDPVGSQDNEAGGQLAFYTNIRNYASPSLTERMRIDSSGNVGIGTVAPLSRLHVEGNITVNASATTQTPLVVRGMASQTGNLTEWRNSSDYVLAYINESGGLYYKPFNGYSTRGLVLLVHLNNETADWSGNNNDGMKYGNANCNSTLGGVISTGCRFDGASGNVSILDSGALAFPNREITIEFWFQLAKTNQDQAFPALVSKHNNLAREFLVYYDNATSTVNLSLGNNTATDSTEIDIQDFGTSRIINDTKWHYIAIAFSNASAAGSARFYVDGLLDVTRAYTLSGNMLKDTAAGVAIGSNAVSGNSTLNGTIDEVAIWNRALSTDEVRNRYLERKALRGYESGDRIGGNLTVIGNLNVTGQSFFGAQSFSTVDTSGNVNIGANLTVSNNVLFASNTTSRVGINTTNPDSTFAVVGNASIDGSTFYVDAGNNRVGIGTAVPNADLHIYKGTAVDSRAVISGGTNLNGELILAEQNDQTIGAGLWYDGDANAFKISTGVSGDVIDTAANTRLTILRDSGKIGIRTTAPQAGLQVNGTFQTNESVYLATGAGSGLVGINTTAPNATLHIMGIGTAGGFRVTNQSNAYEAFFVNSTLGAVGIGTTGPETTFDVNGDVTVRGNQIYGSNAAGTSFSIRATQNTAKDSRLVLHGGHDGTAGAGATIIAYGESYSGNEGNIVLNPSNGDNKGDILFYGAGAEKARVTDAGKVGIGTATPANTLVVNGTGATGGFRVVNQSNSYEAFFVNSTLGRVGIGTAAPRHALTVVGDANVTGTLYVGAQSFSTIDATGNLTVGGYGLINGYLGINATTPNATLHVMGIGTAGGLRVTNQSNGAEVFFVNSTLGAVGIGTTAPSTNLEISASDAVLRISRTNNANTAMIQFNPTGTISSSNVRWAAGLTSSDNIFRIASWDGSTTGNYFNILNSGSVGIRTTAPYRTLQVNGTMQTNESVYLATGAGSGLVGINNTVPNATLHIIGTGTAGGLRVTNQSNAAEIFFVNSTLGAVGIGTTGLGSLLEMQSASPQLMIRTSTASGKDYSGTIRLGEDPTNWRGGYLNYDGGENKFIIGVHDAGDSLTSSDIESIVIDRTTGNVGIGTVAPYRTLQVNGTFQTNESVYLATGLGSGLVGINNTAPNATLHVIGKGPEGGFRVTNQSNAYEAFFVNSTLGRVGIGTASPRHALTVVGDANITGTLYVGSQSFSTIDATGNLTVGGSGSIAGNVSINGTLWQPVYPSDDGLVLYLPFSEGNASGGMNITYDRSPYGNDGTLYNMNTTGNNTMNGTASGWTTGKYGNALGFDGVDDYVDTSLNVDNTKSFSVEAWVKANSLDMTEWQKVMVGDRTAGSTAFELYLAQANNKSIFIVFNDTGNTFTGTSDRVMAVGEWTHLVGIYDASANTVTIYNNGVKGTQTSVSGTISNTAGVVRIGWGTNNARYFNGTIDEVRIYNRALSADEIRTQYLGGAQSHGAIVANKFRIVNTTAAELLRVANDGKMGIGATSPNASLHIIGIGTAGGFRVTNQSNSYEAFFVNSTLGRIGIGTASPRQALAVVGDANVTGTLYVGSQSFSTIDATGNLTVGGYGLINGYLGINATTPNATLHVMGIGTAGGFRVTNQSNAYEAFFVNSTLGAVGIGTTSPAAGSKLHVDGNVTIGNSGDVNQAILYIYGANNGDPAKPARMQLEAQSGQTLILDSATDATPAKIKSNYALDLIYDDANGGTDVLRFLSDATEVMRIDNAGNVGIGTAAPYRTLQVNGTFQTNESVYLATGAGSGLVGINNTVPNATLHIIGTGTAGGLRVTNQSNGAEVFFVNSTLGAVGIGTTAPETDLQIGIDADNAFTSSNMQSLTASEGALVVGPNTAGNAAYIYLGTGNAGVAGGATTGGIRFWSGGNVGAQILGLEGSGGDDGSGELRFETKVNTAGSMTTRMTIDRNGNVGIRTTVPYRTLQVNGTFQTNESVYLATGLGSGLVGINTTAPNATLHVLGTGTAGGLRVTNQSNGAEVFFVNSTSGNVGIGTASPKAESGLTVAYRSISVTGSDNGFNAGGNRAFMDMASGIARMGALSGGGANTQLALYSKSAERVRIDDNGNVGINTIVPRDKLHVEGNATFNASAAGIVPLTVAGMVTQTANLTEWFNGTADIKNNKILAVNSTGAMCFGAACSGQIFFNGTAMIIRVV